LETLVTCIVLGIAVRSVLTEELLGLTTDSTNHHESF